MKLDGYKIICEFLKSDLGDNKIPGQPEKFEDIPKRPIDALNADVIKDAESKSKEYTAGATKDLDPMKIKSIPEKGQSAGDEGGKVAKELGKIEKK